MKKCCTAVTAALLLAAISAVSCAERTSPALTESMPAPAVPSSSLAPDASAAASAAQAAAPAFTDEISGFPQDYIALVESYLKGTRENTVFKTIDEGTNSEAVAAAKALSDLLKGHYDIIGRADGSGLEYYLAVRREDAPVYTDFYQPDVGYQGEQLYIGYYDRDSNPVSLYALDGYSLLDMPLGYDTLDCFCFQRSGIPDAEEHPEFHYAFDSNGRALLDFIKSRPELSFYRKGNPFIRFYYQDENTLDFYSEPYPCYIPLTVQEQNSIRQQLSESDTAENITTVSAARSYLSQKEAVCSTGVSLILDGRLYKLYGNHQMPGYMMVFDEDSLTFLSLEHNEELYRFIMEKTEASAGLDYESFDPRWFKTPLESATLTFPKYTDVNDAPGFQVQSQTIQDRERLDALATLMDEALNRGECEFSACPYVAPLDFIREDGETLRIFIAADSCDSMSYEGRIGFEYGDQEDLAAIFDEAM